MKKRVVARLAMFGPLEREELEHLATMGGDVRQFDRGDIILPEDHRNPELALLLDGWAASTIELSSGARQIVAINLPGDLLGLPGLGVRHPIDIVVALSPVLSCRIETDALWDIFRNWPGIAARMFLVAQQERVMTAERLALTGKAPALTCAAAMFVRLGERLEMLECGAADSFDLPLTQKDMADLIGVTPVHLNGLLRDLREAGLIKLEQRHVTILDLDRLRGLAQVEPCQFSMPVSAASLRNVGDSNT